MATPASLFRPARPQLPTTDAAAAAVAAGAGRDRDDPSGRVAATEVAPVVGAAAVIVAAVIVAPSADAVEFDTIITPSGMLNVLPPVQRVRMSPTDAGRLAHVWADEHNIHIQLDHHPVNTSARVNTIARVKTVSRRTSHRPTCANYACAEPPPQAHHQPAQSHATADYPPAR